MFLLDDEGLKFPFIHRIHTLLHDAIITVSRRHVQTAPLPRFVGPVEFPLEHCIVDPLGDAQKIVAPLESRTLDKQIHRANHVAGFLHSYRHAPFDTRPHGC
jgi:hypothetical protein